MEGFDWEVYKQLKSKFFIGVEGNTKMFCVAKVFEDVDCCSKVTKGWAVLIFGKKGVYDSNIRTCDLG